MNASVPVSIKNLNHYYGSGHTRLQVLNNINLELSAGEIAILTGPSGSGKTTLVSLVGALRSVQGGSLTVFDNELYRARASTLIKTRRSIGYIFQHHNLLQSLTVTQNVQMALQLRTDLWAKGADSRARSTLEAVGMGDRADYYPDQLSGGQKQRVAIARALVGEPMFVVADEPTSSLDSKSGRDVVDLLRHLAKNRNCTILLVTHDNRILDIADRIIHIEDGSLVN